MVRPIWQRLFGAALILAAAAYLVHLVLNDTQSFSEALSAQTPLTLSLATMAAVAMLYLKAIYHASLCQRLSGRRGLFAAILPAYAIAQVVRYLPGKIWGIVYQSNRLSGQLHPGEVVAANTVQTIVTNLLGAGIIASVLGSVVLDSSWLLLGIPCSIAVTEYVHRNPWIEARIIRVLSAVLRRAPADLPAVPPQRVKGTLILCAEWLAYYAVWTALLGDSFSIQAMIILATWYAAASLLAILAIAVPAGIAVREALFVSLATFTAANPGELIGLAALIRIILTLGEVALVPVAQLSSAFLRRPLE